MGRKQKFRTEDLSAEVNQKLLEDISKTLAKQIDWERFSQKYAKVRDVLKLVGLGIFVASSLVMPNLPLALKPFLEHRRKKEYEIWKRFNIPYLKRSLERLEQQKLVELTEENGLQVARITKSGQRKVFKFAIDELAVEKPKLWDGRWTLVSYDIPKKKQTSKKSFHGVFKSLGFLSVT